MSFCPDRSMLAGVDNATLTQWLTDARTAYAALMTGRREVSVSYDGKSVTYAQADMAQLTNWIALLQAQLGLTCGRRALRPYFR